MRVCPETACSASMCAVQAQMTPASGRIDSMWASVSLPLKFWLDALLSVPALSVLPHLCWLSAFQGHWLRLPRVLDFDWNAISWYLFSQHTDITLRDVLGKWQREMPYVTCSSKKSFAFLQNSAITVTLPSYNLRAQTLKPSQTRNNYLLYKGCYLLLTYIQCIQSCYCSVSHCTAALWLDRVN